MHANAGDLHSLVDAPDICRPNKNNTRASQHFYDEENAIDFFYGLHSSEVLAAPASQQA
jgi:hypothetical protein